MDPHQMATMIGLLGCIIISGALLSGLVQRIRLPQVGASLALGALLGPHALGVLDVGLDSSLFRVVATLALAFVLFTDAVTLNIQEVRQHWRLGLIVLGPGTLLSALLLAVAGHFLLELNWALALILGAALASTDPVLLRGILGRRDLPASTRQALQLESGLNDIVLLPLVLVAMAGASPGLLVSLFVLGPGAGVLVGFTAVAALLQVRKRLGMRRDYESIYSLGIAMAAFAGAELLHGSGFLAAFAAGLTICLMDAQLCDCFVEYGETTTEVFLLFSFVLLGCSLIWVGLTVITGPMLVFTFCGLFVRTIVLTLALRHLPPRERNLIAWFGPRGLSTLLLVLLPIFAGMPGAERLFPAACLVVLASVLVHGGGIALLPHSAPTAQDDHLVTLDQLPEGAVLVDVRKPRAYEESGLRLRQAGRIDPNFAREEARRAGYTDEMPLVLFCDCPAEETSSRTAMELRHAGYRRAQALVGGWEALIKAGYQTEPQ